jgi:hypothetical protein
MLKRFPHPQSPSLGHSILARQAGPRDWPTAPAGRRQRGAAPRTAYQPDEADRSCAEFLEGSGLCYRARSRPGL